MTDKDGLSPSFVETIAGFTAGIVSTLCLHPLDLIKTRLQVDRSSHSQIGGSIRVIREISQHEGGLPAFYRGLTPNLIGNSTSWALYFLCYGNIKDALQSIRDCRESELTSSDYFVASGLAGLTTSVLTNPIWVIKTRMLSTGSKAPGAYVSFTSGVMQIYRSEGITGFYRGLLPALFGVSHGALQFMAYERLKVYRSQMVPVLRPGNDSADSGGGPTRRLGNLDFFVFSSLSKIFAGSVTYPYQVLRSRLQTYDAHLVYRSAGDAAMQIWKKEGLAGFYKGLGPNLLRVLPSTWVTFLVYENTKAYLPRLASGQ
ncbi:putative mitochondrial folate carrier protein Flx1 [Aspergillus clavatus NRRL 1]|uniref:Mitochondrial folate carrier protein Flx1, putative n=1 Tax=Aspergillus clavatus (strain ATCC 1007 / CBS 513.65 / DSM 816 / NCTC 3887 / NRRL 1 / QM 1276 / 107) TaxID=344612 RepID=A1CM17_ASPCL|nr:mitochondrial folate carrier protein Flx1, putative [Aspergillus clavatus NRRL 1]EAW08604.1 mitochondrial folate carrier protein Flx1, putative [Aspergillus clavatus NRRL 1]